MLQHHFLFVFWIVCVPEHFREICPAGHGYTYSHSDIQISLRKMDEVEMRGVEEFSSATHRPNHRPYIPSYPQTPAKPQFPTYDSQTPHLPPQVPTFPRVPPQVPTFPRVPSQVPTFPQVPTQPRPSRIPPQPHHPSLDPHQTGKVPLQLTPDGEGINKKAWHSITTTVEGDQIWLYSHLASDCIYLLENK